MNNEFPLTVTLRGQLMKKIAMSFILLIGLVGCQVIDSALTEMGVIDIRESPFDGSKTFTMTPALTNHGYEDAMAELGLYWQESMGNRVIVGVKYPRIDNFAPEKPFLLRVDGEVYQLPPASDLAFGDFDVENLGQYGLFPSTTKYFVATKDVIRAVVNGQHASYRINLLGNQYDDGKITYQYRSYQSYVPKAFERFLDAIQN